MMHRLKAFERKEKEREKEKADKKQKHSTYTPFSFIILSHQLFYVSLIDL